MRTGKKLRAGGRRREKADVAPHEVEILVDVTPQHRPHIRMMVDHGEEVVPVDESDAIEPEAAHVDRMMVQAHERVAAACRAERKVELRKRCGRELAACHTCHRAVEHDHAPGACVKMTAEHERRSCQRHVHCVEEIVVARNAMHRLAKGCKQAAKMRIACGVILHDVAGDENRARLA